MFDRLIRIIENIKSFFQGEFFHKINLRTLFMSVIAIGIGIGLIYRLFVLQIVNGETYLANFQLRIRREVTIPSTRGKIYDRNGNLLAYNELAYSVTMNDLGESSSAHSQELNDTIEKVIEIVEANGDSVSTDFDVAYNEETGHYEYTVSGVTLSRFLADVYGHATINELTEEESSATADDLIGYLCSAKRFRIGERMDPEDETSEFVPEKGYEPKRLLQIVTIRYLLSLNSYQKYIATTVAENVSEKTVAAILENKNDLEGVDISDDTRRQYNDSEYFAQILGYTGKVSSSELEELQKENDSYTSSDVVGKSGIESAMETELQGTKGSEVVYVDNMGNELETSDYVAPVAGSDVYLTIDHDLQVAAQDILERKLADIVYSRIIDAKTYTMGENDKNSNIQIPIYDVYFQMFNNNIIDIAHLSSEDADTTEKAVYDAYVTYQANVISRLRNEMETSKQPYNVLSKEYQDYESYIVQMLKNKGVLVTSRIDQEDETYIDWTTNEVISMAEFLNYAISMDWVDASLINMDDQYASGSEVYTALVEYILQELQEDSSFTKHLYHYMIQSDTISGAQVCMVLIEQGAVTVSDTEKGNLLGGQESALTFMMNRIKNLDITPSQLALYPCTGSIVITDVNSGDVLALVSYPGYDNNKMANGVDADYYSSLQEDQSMPLINNATYQETAPGSTFKPVSATAALMEGVLDLSTVIKCEGIFTKIGDPAPKCWVYPASHGSLTVSGGITNSCNVFFYEVGYRLGLNSEGKYDSDQGVETLRKYADMYGLTDKSGIEIEERAPQVSTEDAVRSAIGQGNASYTTVGLARYVTTIANSGTCYNLTLLDKIQSSDGQTVKENSATVRNVITMDSSYWDAIHTGMRGVVENQSFWSGLSVNAAGKTGTAQESEDKPNHSLFISYAPYESPRIAVATRVANGYTSSYAAQITEAVMEYYFGDKTLDEILGTSMDMDSTSGD